MSLTRRTPRPCCTLVALLAWGCSPSSPSSSKPDAGAADARAVTGTADSGDTAGGTDNHDAAIRGDGGPTADVAPPGDAAVTPDQASDGTPPAPDVTDALPDGARDRVQVPDARADRVADAAGDSPEDLAPHPEADPDRAADNPSTADGSTDAPDALADDASSARSDATDSAPLGKVSVVADNVLSSNATAIKSYDTNVNVASYRQHGILYHQGYQFVAWFNGNARNAVVARRSLDPTTLQASAWSWAYVRFILSSDGDSHNVISMGVSPVEGRLHLAIGQHGAQLYTIRSGAGAVTAQPWDNAVFGGTGTSDSGAAAPMAGLPGYPAATNQVTYPYFLDGPEGTLQLAYRTGSSGDGEMQLAEYHADSGDWSYVGPFTSATGSYTQNNVTSSSRNAYPHGLDYDGAGRLHMAFTFRENLNLTFIAGCTSTISNHDTLYMYSDDRGRTWKNNAGATVSDLRAGSSAGIASPGLVIDPLPIGRDLMNQETQIPDHANLLHAVISYVPDRYQPGCATDRSQAQPHHLWRAADGTWSKTEIRLGGQDVNQGYDRSKLFVDAGDNLYLLLPDLRLLGASAGAKWTDWRLLWDGRSRGNYGEAIIDRTLTREAGGVSVLYLKDTTGSTGELHVLDLRIGP
jgi:hypothetical protein